MQASLREDGRVRMKILSGGGLIMQNVEDLSGNRPGTECRHE